jgi:hypothetical protein
MNLLDTTLLLSVPTVPAFFTTNALDGSTGMIFVFPATAGRFFPYRHSEEFGINAGGNA